MNDPEKILHGFLEISVSGDQLELREAWKNSDRKR